MSNITVLENRLQELETSHRVLNEEIIKVKSEIIEEKLKNLKDENQEFIGKQCKIYIGYGYDGIDQEIAIGKLLDIDTYYDEFLDGEYLKVKLESGYLIGYELEPNTWTESSDPNWITMITYIEEILNK